MARPLPSLFCIFTVLYFWVFMTGMLTASDDEQTVEDPEKIDELEQQRQRPPLLYLLTSGLSSLYERLTRSPTAPTLLHHRYSLVSQIGEGAFAHTFLAEDSFTHQRVAIKIVEPACRRVSLAEVHNLALLKSDYIQIPKVLDSFDLGRAHCVVMELLQQVEDLSQVSVPKQRLEILRKLTWSVCLQLNHLHAHNLIHADVKVENIMRRPDSTQEYVLIDYGNAFDKSMIDVYYEDWELQSLLYRAPEILFERRPLSEAIDYWALGVSLLELAGGRNPFMPVEDVTRFGVVEQIFGLLGPFPSHFVHHTFTEFIQTGDDPAEDDALLRRTRAGNVAQFTRVYDVDFVDFVNQLLVYDPSARLQGLSALRHPFLRSLSPILCFLD